MNPVQTQHEPVDCAPEPAAELSAEERQVLARIARQAPARRPQSGKDRPVFYYPPNY